MLLHETKIFITFINTSKESKVEFKYRLTIYAMRIKYVHLVYLEPVSNKNVSLSKAGVSKLQPAG